jgi:hypothetical protein
MMNPDTDPLDHDAFTRAIAHLRNESKARSTQIDAMLADRAFEEVGRFAAFAVQMDTLGLPPWATPPCQASLAHLDKPRNDPRGERLSAELLKRMMGVGLSRYEPFPLLALGRLGALPMNEKVNYAAPAAPFKR